MQSLHSRVNIDVNIQYENVATFLIPEVSYHPEVISAVLSLKVFVKEGPTVTPSFS
jgi:hypothetical protein